MSKPVIASTAAYIIPIEIADIIGAILPICGFEDPQQYWGLFEQIALPLRLKDYHEYMIVKTIVDCHWQNNRYERAKARMIDLRFREALFNILVEIVEEDTIKVSRGQDAKELVEDYFKDPETKEEIERHLYDYNMDVEHVRAEAMRLAAPDLLQLQKLIDSNERRRSLAIRDFEYYREMKMLSRSDSPKALPAP
jgi:hypothetical protein